MIKIEELSVGQRIGLELLWWGAKLFAILPYWFKFYVVEPILYALLHHLLHYRRKVVMTNLRNSFPSKSDEELKRIARGFYHNLAEVFIGTLNIAHMPRKKIGRYFRMREVEGLLKVIADRDVIVTFAHHGLWELGMFWIYVNPTHESLGVYHQLRSKVMDLFYQRLRSTYYSVPVQKKECMRFYLQHRSEGYRGRKLALGLIADQNPPRRPDAHWYRFLNQDTVFVDGAEQLATRYHLPIVFAPMYRVGRGRYEMAWEVLYEPDEQVEKNEITERYVRCLEQMICDNPEIWMWSHRRWKQKRNVAR